MIMAGMDYCFPKSKKKKINRYCKILSTASFFPEKVVSNEDIIKRNDLKLKSEAIKKSLGVDKRHIADDHHDDSDVLFMSAQKCLTDYGLMPEDLSRLIVNKSFGDHLLPMTASRLLAKLNSSKAVHSFDIDGGISSFLHSVDVISKFINTGDDHVLLSSGGINTKFVSKKDPRVAFLYGDASASVLFGYSDRQHIMASYFYSNHNYYNIATTLSPISASEIYRAKGSLQKEDLSFMFDAYRMDNWKIAEDFYRKATTKTAENILEESGLRMDDIDLVLITENNLRIWELTLETLGIHKDKSISKIKENGNTMSAMLPLLLDCCFRDGRIQEGMNIMFISHGEGFSGGGLIYRD